MQSGSKSFDSNHGRICVEQVGQRRMGNGSSELAKWLQKIDWQRVLSNIFSEAWGHAGRCRQQKRRNTADTLNKQSPHIEQENRLIGATVWNDWALCPHHDPLEDPIEQPAVLKKKMGNTIEQFKTAVFYFYPKHKNPLGPPIFFDLLESSIDLEMIR